MQVIFATCNVDSACGIPRSNDNVMNNKIAGDKDFIDLWRSASERKVQVEKRLYKTVLPPGQARTVQHVLRTSVTRGTDIMTRSATAQEASDYQFSVCWANSTAACAWALQELNHHSFAAGRLQQDLVIIDTGRRTSTVP